MEPTRMFSMMVALGILSGCAANADEGIPAVRALNDGTPPAGFGLDDRNDDDAADPPLDEAVGV